MKGSNDPASVPKVKVLGRVRTALAKVVHSDLSNLKRVYKVEGFSEAEIHAVIPDRPVKKKGGRCRER